MFIYIKKNMFGSLLFILCLFCLYLSMKNNWFTVININYNLYINFIKIFLVVILISVLLKVNLLYISFGFILATGVIFKDIYLNIAYSIYLTKAYSDTNKKYNILIDGIQVEIKIKEFKFMETTLESTDGAKTYIMSNILFYNSIKKI